LQNIWALFARMLHVHFRSFNFLHLDLWQHWLLCFPPPLQPGTRVRTSSRAGASWKIVCGAPSSSKNVSLYVPQCRYFLASLHSSVCTHTCTVQCLVCVTPCCRPWFLCWKCVVHASMDSPLFLRWWNCQVFAKFRLLACFPPRPIARITPYHCPLCR
jgi:hypothetical protein